MNLTTAKSLERSKEVGVRKVSGARKLQLIFQFMSESVLLNSVAIILALGLVILILPYFNLLTGKHLLMGLSWGSSFFLLTGIPLVGIILSGLYPAFLLSGFKPSIILKGKPSYSFKNLNFRKSFVIVQFLITIVLLIGSLTIMKQMHFLSNQPLGFSQHNILSIKGEFIDDNENYMNSLKTLKGEIQKLSFVEGVASAGTYPGEGYDNLNSYMGVVYPDGTRDDRTVWYNFRVDEDFFSLLQIEILAGKAFENNGDINRNKVIINEKAAIKMGLTNFKEAINQKIKFNGRDCYIIGIMKNHHHFGLKNEVEPFIMTYSGISNGLLVKLNEKATSLAGIGSAIKQLKEQWKHLFPKSTFQYVFINDTLNMLYAEERMFSKAFTIFTILAIIIASLGLFGLAFYRSLLRTKEIGIRKVNGARVTEILSMLNNDYLIWVTIAFILACPIAWYAMNKWLQNFAYKTEMSWWIFALAGLLSLMVALATVSWQSYRAATRNPVESLKDE
jgi:putative ABC transport system permease protein